MGVIVIVHMTMADLLRLDAAPFVVGSSILTETAGTLQIGIGQHLLRRAAGHDLARQQQRLIEPLARLRRIILLPSILLVWILGLSIATSYGFQQAGWIHAKLLLAFLLSGYQGWLTGVGRRMANGERPVAERTLRIWNEVPALFTILMVGLAVLKPF